MPHQIRITLVFQVLLWYHHLRKRGPEDIQMPLLPVMFHFYLDMNQVHFITYKYAF